MTIDADTIRRTRKRLRNHGRRTDGTFYGHDANGDVRDVDDVLWVGHAFTDEACLLGALALETGEWFATQEAAWAAWRRLADPAGHGVAGWNDQATNEQVFDLLDQWEAELL